MNMWIGADIKPLPDEFKKINISKTQWTKMQSQIRDKCTTREVEFNGDTFVARDIGFLHNKIKGMLLLQVQSEATNEKGDYILDHSNILDANHTNLRLALLNFDVKNG